MKHFFGKIVDVKPDEIRALWLGFVFHFLILTGYYIMRPIRDSIAASNRLETLPWMFTATLVGMLIANAVFAAIVARMPRRNFIPIAYAFFIFNLALFYVLMRSCPPAQQVWIGRALYVWVSVFNLFNTAIFWAFMTDLFTVEQGKRLYGFIAVGGSLGAILGAYITKNYVRDIGPANLLAISAITFAVAGFLVRFFPSGFAEQKKIVPAREEPIGGSIWSGITHIAHSPYLMGLAASILLYTTTSTWAYFQQTDLAGEALKSSDERTVFLANLEIWVNSVTDTLGYRIGDQLGAWSYGGLHALGLGLQSISFVAVPVVAGWCGLSLWLARKQRALADAQRDALPPTDVLASEAA